MSQPYPASFSPLLLQAQVTVQPAGETGVPDPTRLENPYQGPMWLDEIRFTLPGAGTLGLSWSSIYVKFFLGGLPMTQGNVPISLFGKALNDSVDRTNIVRTPPYRFTWKLPKPLFIPAREYLRPVFYYAPYSGAAAVPVTLTYAVRPLPVGTPTPTTLQLPWVASWVPPFASASEAESDRVDESQPSDLYNPWDQDLHVQRFVGRLMVEGAQGEENGNMALADASPNLQILGPGNDACIGTLVTAQDSFNNILIRDPSPFAHVFDFVDRSWTVNALLPPKGFYQFTIERFWSDYGTLLIASPAISMVGWREVVYAP